MDETRDLYDNACVLLALAALFAATDRIAYRKQIEILLTAIDTTLADPAGGWAEDEHGTLPRRQNPHMHLFEACLVLATKTRDASHHRRLDGLYTLFLEQFYNRGAGPLCEFFGPAWERGPKLQSERLDPGHMCEWTWLLHRYSDAFGVQTDAMEQQLLDTARRIGGAGGILLVDEVSEAGESLARCRRLWLQAEFLKALVTRFKATGEHRYLGAADMVAPVLQDVYLSHTPPGTWRDNFDLCGKCIAARIPLEFALSLMDCGRRASPAVRLRVSPRVRREVGNKVLMSLSQAANLRGALEADRTVASVVGGRYRQGARFRDSTAHRPRGPPS